MNIPTEEHIDNLVDKLKEAARTLEAIAVETKKVATELDMLKVAIVEAKKRGLLK